MPREAYFLLVDKCNARCSFCQRDFFRAHSEKEISLNKFITIARNIRLEHMNTVVLTGGEPLLNKDFLGIVSFINQLYPRVSIVICTNGIALTKDLTEEILCRNVYSLNISINAATSGTYKRIMQVDCFEKVIENIKYYQELCLKLKKQSRLNLSFVASKKNMQDLLEFIKLAKSLNVKELSSTYCRFFPMTTRLTLAIKKDNLFEDSDSLYFHQELSDRCFKEADILAKHLNINFTHEYLFSEPVAMLNSVSKCQFPFSSILIGLDGEVFPCCGGEAMFNEKVNRGLYDFGNAFKQPIENFWCGKYYQALRYSTLHPDNPAVPECGACSYILKWKGNIKKAHLMQWDELSDKLIDFKLMDGK